MIYRQAACRLYRCEYRRICQDTRYDSREASDYLNRYKGLDFLAEHYAAEHRLSIRDSVQDLTRVCRNNGGGIV